MTPITENLAGLIRVLVSCACERSIPTDGRSIHRMAYLYLRYYRPNSVVRFGLDLEGPYSPDVQDVLEELVLLNQLHVDDDLESNGGELTYSRPQREECGCYDVSSFLDWLQRGSTQALPTLAFVQFLGAASGRSIDEAWVLAKRLSSNLQAEEETRKWYSEMPTLSH